MELKAGTENDKATMLSLSRKQIEPYFRENGLEWNAAEREGLLNQSELFSIIEGEHCGYVQLFQKGEELYIYDLQIFSEVQNRGVGTKVINRVKEIAKNRGLVAVRLGTFKSNPASRLYVRLGFCCLRENEYFIWYKCTDI